MSILIRYVPHLPSRSCLPDTTSHFVLRPCVYPCVLRSTSFSLLFHHISSAILFHYSFHHIILIQGPEPQPKFLSHPARSILEETFVVSQSPQKWLANKNIPDTYHQSFLIIPPSNSFYYVGAYDRPTGCYCCWFFCC